MTEQSVWAPRAKSVDIDIDGVRLPLRADADGWFRITIGAGPGTDYGLCVDGGDPRPDPRSLWQPAGVHGRSRLYDHRAFAWSDSAWQAPQLGDIILYELHVGTFTPGGTFDSAIEKLDHLVDLGIGAIELMPVAEFSGNRGWGYDGVDLYAPHHAYGGPDGLKRLVDAAHARGLAVVLDVVYNHAGADGNYLDEFGPYFTDRHMTPWGRALNADGPDGAEVRRFVVDNALMWLRDYHIDGLRLDAVDRIIDTSSVHILAELATAVGDLSRQLGRQCWLIGESDRNDPELLLPPHQAGYGLDAQWADDFHHAIHAKLTGESDGYYVDFGATNDIVRAFRDIYVYAGRYSQFRQAERGRSAGDLGGDRFVVCIQNHDQIGNRAVGDRLGALVDRSRLRIAAALLLFAPCVPMLFMGEEWAAATPFQYFVDHEDPLLRDAVRRGRAEEWSAFGWDPDDVPDPGDPQTHADSRLDWTELPATDHAAMLEWYRSLIRLRVERHLTAGSRDVDIVTIAATDTLVIRRGVTVLAANFSGSAAAIATTATEVLLMSVGDTVLAAGTLSLPGNAVALLALPDGQGIS